MMAPDKHHRRSLSGSGVLGSAGGLGAVGTPDWLLPEGGVEAGWGVQVRSKGGNQLHPQRLGPNQGGAKVRPERAKSTRPAKSSKPGSVLRLGVEVGPPFIWQWVAVV